MPHAVASRLDGPVGACTEGAAAPKLNATATRLCVLREGMGREGKDEKEEKNVDERRGKE